MNWPEAVLWCVAMICGTVVGIVAMYWIADLRVSGLGRKLENAHDALHKTQAELAEANRRLSNRR